MTDEERDKTYWDAIRAMTAVERRFWFLYLTEANLSATQAYRLLRPGVKDATCQTGGCKLMKHIREKIGDAQLMEAFNLGVPRLYSELDQRLKATTPRYWREVCDEEDEKDEEDDQSMKSKKSKWIFFEDNQTRMRATELLADLHGKRKNKVDVHHSGSVESVVKIYLPDNGRDQINEENKE